jgi:citronellol/citronellal dehydrogenase
MGVNARAAFLASHYAMPHLRERGGHIIMMSPPIGFKALPGKAPYLLSKFGMTMLAQAIDQEEDRVCAQALWPVTGVRTAATEVFGMGELNEWRTPEILADATVALLARDPLKAKFHAWLDEELLRAEGVTDFTRYRCSPEHEPSPLSIQLIDPEWTPPW